MTDQNPATPPKKHHAAIRKEKADAFDSLLKEHGVTTLEELQAKLVNETTPPAQPDPMAGWKPADIEIPADDLAWITPDHFEIHFVLRKHNVTYRPAKPHLQPQLIALMLRPTHTAEWPACPFNLRDPENHERDLFLQIKYKKWNHFMFTRDNAEDMYRDDRFPLPKKAVISHTEFRGWSNQAGRALGVHRDLVNPDPLREAMRRCLQRFPGQLFINFQHHPEMPGNAQVANPYGNSLENHRLPVVHNEQLREGVLPNLGLGTGM